MYIDNMRDALHYHLRVTMLDDAINAKRRGLGRTEFLRPMFIASAADMTRLFPELCATESPDWLYDTSKEAAIYAADLVFGGVI